MNQRSFWLACFLSIAIHGACLAIVWGFQFLQPVSTPLILLPYGDSEVEGMSVSALSADPGSLYQAMEDRPGGEVMRGPINRVPAPLAAAEALPAPEVQPAGAAPLSQAAEAELAPSEPAPEALPVDEPAAAPDLPTPTMLASPTTPAAPSAASKPSLPVPPPSALAAVGAVDAARGLTAPNGRGANPAEAPGVGKAAGQQGSARMATGTPSAGGRVGYTNGVSLVSYPKPYYPPEARSAGLQGTVLVWLKVSTEGRVVDAHVERSSGHAILDAAAVRFAYSVRLQPARQGAIPVVAEAKLPVAYRLVD